MADQPEMEHEELIEETVEETPEITEEPSVRDTLEAAIEQHESAEEAPAEEEPQAEVPPEEPELAAEDVPRETKPPVGWDPVAKEHWKELPDHVREAVSAREAEINDAMANTGQYRRAAESLQRISQQFQPVMQAHGANDFLQASAALMQTASVLKFGSQSQKAEMMAKLIKDYELDIGTLDNVLSGNLEVQEQAPPSDPRVDQMYQMMQQGMVQQQQQMQHQAGQSIHEFAQSHDFMEDPKFRNTMADFLDLARVNGQDITLDDAYQKTIAALPQFAQVVAQRAANQQTQQVQQKHQAAASVSGQRGGTSDIAQNDGSIRAILESQFDQPGRI